MIDLRRTLVPTDFSKHSQHALRYATALAARCGSELYMLHVLQDLSVVIPDAVNVAPLVTPPVEQLLGSVRTALDKVIDENQLRRFPVHAEALEGAPFYEIIRFAKERDIDLIIMGTHGHT